MSKRCERCQKVFFKKTNCSKKRWPKVRYCSHKCSSLAWIGHKGSKASFKKGHTPWNKGKRYKCPAISKARTGTKLSEETKRKISIANSGEKAHQWKGGISKTKGYNAIYKKRYRARKRNAEGSHTTKEWENLKEKVHYRCLDCGKLEPNIKLTEDHIQPLSKGGSDYIWNIQPLCQSCNSRKHNSNTNFFTKVNIN